MKNILRFLLLFLLLAKADAATVVFTMTNNIGQVDTNRIKITPINSYINADGSVQVRGLPFWIYPATNGVVSTNLPYGSYLATNQFIVSVFGTPASFATSQGIIFQVPNSTGTYQFGNIAQSGYNVYNYNGQQFVSTASNILYYLGLTTILDGSVVTNLIVAATNGMTSIVYSNPLTAFTTPSQVTNIVTSIASTSSVSLLTITNVANSVYSNNPANYATTNYVNTGTNIVQTTLQAALVATNNALAGIIQDSTNSINGVIASETNTLNAYIAASSNSVYQAKQQGSLVLSNLANTGAITNISSGTNVVLSTNGLGVIAINAPLQTVLTNGFGDIVYSNHGDFLTPSQLGPVTNGFVSSAITNGLATTNYVNNATNGLVTASVTNGLATTAYAQSVTNGLASINYVTSSTNGFVTASITNGLASTNYVNSSTNPLATQAYVNTSTNSLTLLFASVIATANASTLASANAYTTTATNGSAISASNTAALMITYSNALVAIGVTNAEATMLYAQFLNTNSAIAMINFTYLPVNTIYFTVNRNVYWSPVGIWYYYDGANWDLYTPATGTLYYLGGASPVGNTYVTINGVAPAGSSYFTNFPVSSYQLGIMTNIADNVPLGGVLGGVPTNATFSANATNIISIIAQNSETNGVNATNVVVQPGLGITVTTNTPSNWTIAGMKIFNTNATVGVVLTNATSIAIGTNTSGISGGSGTTYFFAPTNGTVGNVFTNANNVWIGTNTSSFTVTIYSGSVDPNGTVTAPKGAIYTRFDSQSNFLYSLVNTNGITGWQE